jgi:hypothetical protein
VLLAYDTERRLQNEGLAKKFTLAEWWVEAGPDYYDGTVTGAKKAVAEVHEAIKARDSKPYSTRGK